MRSTIDANYGFSEFIRDYGSVHGEGEIDYEHLLRLYFAGELDEFVESVEFDAIELDMNATDRRIHGESNKIMPAFLVAARNCTEFVRGVFISHRDSGAEPFLRHVEGVLREEGMRERLDALMLDRTIPIEDRRSIARVIDYDFETAISSRSETDRSKKPAGNTMFEYLAEFGFDINPVMVDGSEMPNDALPRYASKEEFGRHVIIELMKIDPSRVDELLNESDRDDSKQSADAPVADGYSDPEEFEGGQRRKLTVSEARRRVMADTGQSERSIIRETKGWTADEIIALIA